MSGDERFSSPDVATDDFDDAVAGLVRHVERVVLAQERLRALLRAVQSVVREIELPAVLAQIVEAAARLAAAEYAAIGIPSSDRSSLDQFITFGMDAETTAEIGRLPRGLGLLGTLLHSPTAIRLDHLADDPRFAGFPAHHPPMESFLGVPVRTRGEIVGSIYLTNRHGGSFTEEDEQLVQALASTAGFAIQNARLLEDARLREEWMAATAALSAEILSSAFDEAPDLLVQRVIGVAAAARVCVVVPSDDPAHLRVVAVAGDGRQSALGDLPATSEYAIRALRSHEPQVARTAPAAPDDPVRIHLDEESGPLACVPLRSRQRAWGALAVARPPGGAEFTALEVRMIGDMASQASIARELAYARREQQRAVIADERARIARDLHDHVIQQLFAAGLGLQAVAASVDGRDRGSIDEIVQQLDDAIAQIRTVVFALTTRDNGSVRHRLIDVVAEGSGSLPHPPALRFSGPVDHLVDDALADDIVGVARELLSNSVRHAHADQISLDVEAKEHWIRVVVTDDGRGIHTDRRSGLENLANRAHVRGGRLDLDSDGDGTRAEWRVPLASRREGAGR